MHAWYPTEKLASLTMVGSFNGVGVIGIWGGDLKCVDKEYIVYVSGSESFLTFKFDDMEARACQNESVRCTNDDVISFTGQCS